MLQEIHAQMASSSLSVLPDLTLEGSDEASCFHSRIRCNEVTELDWALLLCRCCSRLLPLLLLSCKGTVYFPRAFCSTRELFHPRVPQCNAAPLQMFSLGWKNISQGLCFYLSKNIYSPKQQAEKCCDSVFKVTRLQCWGAFDTPIHCKIA